MKHIRSWFIFLHRQARRPAALSLPALGLLIWYLGACAAGSGSVGTPRSIEDQLLEGQDLIIRGKTFEKDFDFSEILEAVMTVPGRQQAWCASNLIFENCTFKGKFGGSGGQHSDSRSTFFTKNVTFLHCDFEGEVQFRHCTFLAEAKFMFNAFHKDVNFEEASFRGKATFQNNHFFENARFQNSTFHEPVTFYKTLFHRNAEFQGSRFKDHAQWSLVQILGYGDFTVTEFDRDFLFNYGECEGRLVFDHSFFRKRAEMIDLKARDLSLRSCAFHSLKMTGAEITGKLDTEDSYYFSRSPLTDLSETGISIP